MTTKRTISYIPYSFVPNHTPTIEALACSRLSGREFRIVLFIMRQTDGSLRDEDQISPSFFARKTAIPKSHISHALARLKKLKIISVSPGHPPTYSVNPPSRWDKASFAENGEPDSPKTARTLAESGENHSPPKDNLKKTTKDNLKITYIDPNKYTRGKYGHLVNF